MKYLVVFSVKIRREGEGEIFDTGINKIEMLRIYSVVKLRQSGVSSRWIPVIG